MRICFDSLQQLVPTIPNGARLDRVQLIQHVIDYIADLELILKHTQRRRGPPSDCGCRQQLLGHGPPPSLPPEATSSTPRPTAATRDCSPTIYPLRGVQNISTDDSEDSLYISKDDLL